MVGEREDRLALVSVLPPVCECLSLTDSFDEKDKKNKFKR